MTNEDFSTGVRYWGYRDRVWYTSDHKQMWVSVPYNQVPLHIREAIKEFKE